MASWLVLEMLASVLCQQTLAQWGQWQRVFTTPVLCKMMARWCVLVGMRKANGFHQAVPHWTQEFGSTQTGRLSLESIVWKHSNGLEVSGKLL